MVEYYDIVLGLIPGIFLLVLFLAFIANVQFQVSIFIGGLMSAVVVLHALFVRSPTPTEQNGDAKQFVDDTQSQKLLQK